MFFLRDESLPTSTNFKKLFLQCIVKKKRIYNADLINDLVNFYWTYRDSN